MRLRSVLRTGAALSAAVFLLSACSSQAQNGFVGLPRSGVSLRHPGASTPTGKAAGPALANIRNSLLVSDVENSTVQVLHPVSWTNRGKITDGLNNPYGNWVDRNGSLYVANFGTPSNVTEYNSNGDLVFTYPGMDLTIAVTTDRVGNVYEAAASGYVTEYAQGIAEPTATCSPGGQVQGVAVDRSGDVFISDLLLDSSGSRVIEYEGGLGFSHCTKKVLPMRFVDPAGMAFDRLGRLLVCDIEGQVVDIVPHPYTAVAGTLGSGFIQPFSITINQSGTQAYVTDIALSNVQVLSYPGGSTIATIGQGSGLSSPTSAVSSRNYVP